MNGLMKFEVPMTKVISKGNMGMDLMYNPCQETMLLDHSRLEILSPKHKGLYIITQQLLFFGKMVQKL